MIVSLLFLLIIIPSMLYRFWSYFIRQHKFSIVKISDALDLLLICNGPLSNLFVLGGIDHVSFIFAFPKPNTPLGT